MHSRNDRWPLIVRKCSLGAPLAADVHLVTACWHSPPSQRVDNPNFLEIRDVRLQLIPVSHGPTTILPFRDKGGVLQDERSAFEVELVEVNDDVQSGRSCFFE